MKGHGKGAGKGAKGKSKNKGKSRDTPALEDMPPEEQLGEALKKLKKTKELLTQTHSNYEEALEKVKGLKYLTKPIHLACLTGAAPAHVLSVIAPLTLATRGSISRT